MGAGAELVGAGRTWPSRNYGICGDPVNQPRQYEAGGPGAPAGRPFGAPRP